MRLGFGRAGAAGHGRRREAMTGHGMTELGQELRRLRVSKGLSQRALTKRLGLSAHSNIADYETGRRIPPRDILSACERVLEADTLVPMLDKALAARAERAVPATARHPRRWVMPVVLVIVAGAAVGWSAVRPFPSPATPRQPVTTWDGNDPRAAGCATDAVSLDSQPVGTIGTVLLRYSPACRAAWAKFHPASAAASPQKSPEKAMVVVEAVRPADGIKTIFQYPSLTQVYGDVLLTATGCVRASATVTLADGTAATGSTACLSGPVT